jgi:hypothetical protein
MKVEVIYQTTEIIEIEDTEKYKPLLKEDDYKLRTDLYKELSNRLGIKKDSVENIVIQSCYAVEVDNTDCDELLFEY